MAICKEIYREEGILVSTFHSRTARLFVPRGMISVRDTYTAGTAIAVPALLTSMLSKTSLPALLKLIKVVSAC